MSQEVWLIGKGPRMFELFAVSMTTFAVGCFLGHAVGYGKAIRLSRREQATQEKGNQ